MIIILSATNRAAFEDASLEKMISKGTPTVEGRYILVKGEDVKR